MTAALRKSKACEETKETALHAIGTDIGFKTCIGNYYSQWLFPWIEAYQMYQKGVLPFPGSMSEQPNKVIELFRVIDSHQSEKTEKRLKKMEMANRRGAAPRGR